MEFTVEDALAFATNSEERKARVCETRRLLEERSAHLMLQCALLKKHIDVFQNELTSMGIENHLTGVEPVCTCAPLNPALWSTLPVELIQLVFARLPFREIIRLRVLSKTWDRHVTGATAGFTQLCAEANPNIFSLVTERHDFFGEHRGLVGTRLYDSKAKGWHHFVHQTAVQQGCEPICAGDGGLVCIASTDRDKEEFSFVIFVCDPLTTQWRELPSSSLRSFQPRIVQLVIDQDSKRYKVVVVGPKEQPGEDMVAKIYSSVTEEWTETTALSDLVSGGHHAWNNDPDNDAMAILLAANLGP